MHARWLPLLCGALMISAAWGDGTGLEWVAKDATRLVGGYRPNMHALTADKPAEVTQLPDGLVGARFTTLKAGTKVYTFCVDQPAGQPMRLWVDATGAGTLAAVDFKELGGGSVQLGTCPLTVNVAGEDRQAAVVAYAFTPKDPRYPKLKDSLFLYSDYAFKGPLQLGDKAYNVLITDPALTFSFSPPSPGQQLLIDITGNGRYSERGKVFLLNKPFNIGGTSYVIKGIGAGGAVQLDKSDTPVAEVPLAPNLNVGQIAPSFKATTLSGKAIDFPTSFKGHIVMLDFWATWCGPCMGEVPNVVDTYGKFHGRGFDILGITLDQKDMADKLRNDFLPAHKMTWEQVYDGKFWQAAVADQYAVQAIPKMLIIDGDSGKILAADVRGPALPAAVEAALKGKGL
jgi:thiol-disulfide isomerase/thioredoxin